jgi:hypothetical protein
MPEIHFRSMEASQNKSNVINRFGDRDFVLAVCTCFIRKCDRFEDIRDFRSLNHGGNRFSVSGSIEHRRWRHHSIAVWRFSYSLSRNFSPILFRSKVIQEFHVFYAVKKFFSIWGANMALKLVCKSRHPQKTFP